MRYCYIITLHESTHTAVIPAKGGIQYAASFRFHHGVSEYWIVRLRGR
jgi:mannose-6-phosphate isomerase-like protein (cupin superfamily)